MLNRLFSALRGRGARVLPAPSAAPAPDPAIPLDALRERLEQGDSIAVCGELHTLANRHPGNADVLALYGWALFEVSAINDAREALAAALRLRPDHLDALNTMGAMAAELEHPADAIGWFEDVLDAAPDDAATKYNLGQVLFLDGQYKRGFELLRFRHDMLYRSDNPLAPLPVWQGEDMAGKHLFVWCDWGGLGDHLQFVRYVPLLRERARPARLTLGCAPGFGNLFSRIEGVDAWVPTGQSPVADMHCPLLNLPRLFGTDLDSVPATIPYLRADAALAAEWAQRLAKAGLPEGTLRAGLVWKSTGPGHEALIYQRMRRTKSIPPYLLGILADSNASFISLQVGVSPQESMATNLKLYDCSGAISSFDDTAAIIANLDVVVSADTSVAHLAGAMGKPVLLLLRRESGMFWLHDRADSPWYPDMRILRQQSSGEWRAVLEEAAHWLRVAARDGAQAIAPGAHGK